MSDKLQFHKVKMTAEGIAVTYSFKLDSDDALITVLKPSFQGGFEFLSLETKIEGPENSRAEQSDVILLKNPAARGDTEQDE